MFKSIFFGTAFAIAAALACPSASATPEFDTNGTTFDGYQCGCHRHGMAFKGTTENEAAAAAYTKCGTAYSCVKRVVAHPYSHAKGSRLPGTTSTSATTTH